jgi:hypothetical protein
MTKETGDMSTRATGTAEIKIWDEKPYNETEGWPKFTHASVTESFHGDIEGTGTVEYLMMYREDGSISFVSMERVVGRVGARTGSFVLQGSGTFEDGTARGISVVVPGSGTRGLSGLRGECSFLAPRGQDATFTLDYDLE